MRVLAFCLFLLITLCEGVKVKLGTGKVDIEWDPMTCGTDITPGGNRSRIVLTHHYSRWDSPDTHGHDGTSGFLYPLQPGQVNITAEHLVNGYFYHAFVICHDNMEIQISSLFVPCVFWDTTGPLYMVCLGVAAACVVSLSAFQLMKKFYADSIHKEEVQRGTSSLEIPLIDKREDQRRNTVRTSTDTLKQIGYASSILGQICFFIVVAVSVVQLSGLVVLCLDRYNTGPGYPAFALFGENLIGFFMLWWIGYAAWWMYLMTWKQRLRTYFLLRTQLHKATLVEIVQPQDSKDREKNWFRRLVIWFMFQPTRELCPVQKPEYEGGVPFIWYRMSKWVWDEEQYKFVPGFVELPTTNHGIRSCAAGIASDEHIDRRERVGMNVLKIPGTTWRAEIFDELFSFTFIINTVIYWFWFFAEYFIVAFVFLGFNLSLAALSIYTRYKNREMLQQLAVENIRMKVIRDGKWTHVESHQLVPGDCFEVQEGTHIPCDAVVVHGNCLVNESALTGESMPQHKMPVPSNNEPFDSVSGQHMIFAGTVIVQSGEHTPEKEETVHQNQLRAARAVVINTGMWSLKGQLIQHILWPQPFLFRFWEHAARAFAIFVAVGAVFTIALIARTAGSDGLRALENAFFFITKIISPLSIIILSFCRTITSMRLGTKKVNCLEPNRLPVCGKLHVMCFDKTGTLTEEGMEFTGVCPALYKNEKAYLDENTLIRAQFCADIARDSNLPRRLVHGMAVCHSLSSLNNQLCGSQLEIKMFLASGWDLHFPTTPNANIVCKHDLEELEVLKRHAFDYNRQCMTVVVRDPLKSGVFAITKGSAEKMAGLCDHDSLPPQYEKVANIYAAAGFYVLGMAYRFVEDFPEDQPELVSRDSLERNMYFLGLLLFRNEPRLDAHDAVAFCKGSGCRVVMITGDNVITSCHVARTTGMIMPDSEVVILDCKVTDDIKDFTWNLAKPEGVEHIAETQALDLIHQGNEVGMTSSAFEQFGDMINQPGQFVDELGGILLKTRIFARMKPQQKLACVKQFMALGLMTGMCGDGGNDTAALRGAHVGIAMSDAEAAMVSHFNIPNKDITGIEEIMTSGRSTLVIAFTTFKFLILSGLAQGAGTLAMVFIGSRISTSDFLFMDVAITLPLALAMSVSRPKARLDRKRPNAGLAGPRTMISIGVQQLVGMIHTIIGYFAVTRECKDREITISAYVIFFNICAQILAGAMTFTIGGRRQAIGRNWVFLTLWIVQGTILLTLLMTGTAAKFIQGVGGVGKDSQSRSAQDRNNDLLMSERAIVAGIMVSCVVVSVALEWLVLGPLAGYFRSKHQTKRVRITNY